MDYAGFTVLDFAQPDRSEAQVSQFKRKQSVLNTKTTRRFIDDRQGFPTITRQFDFAGMSKAETVQMRAFLLSRVGMAVPFWVPTWQIDFQLAQDVQPSATTLTVKDVSYSTLVYPTTPGRRYIAFINNAGNFNICKITGAVRNLGAGTETLSLSAPVGAAYTAGSEFISFLTLCRLDTDDCELEYLTAGMAQASLQMTELPWEAPA